MHQCLGNFSTAPELGELLTTVCDQLRTRTLNLATVMPTPNQTDNTSYKAIVFYILTLR